MAIDTRGRWPVVGAGALIPATVLARGRPALRPLAALLWHQTEEWVWPGSFLPWMNREVIGSDEDEFPLDRRLGFVINVIFGWGLSAATAAGTPAAAPTALLYVSHLGNAGLHLSWALRHRRYDPGSVTSAATLLPVAITGLVQLHADPAVSRRTFRAGLASGIAVAAALMPALKWRLRRPRR
jgi:hypothetical protein